ncbi:hypothetical protein NC653_029485 [Populus alba x Populus x berolinensis]|uniref:Uncharacterized protein n=1 Tax=Populus alba x Populus x berolinensis TaxID=444605 RepID=A0AAD6Q388_9ROSI|nr:hypothetical protein NC653_029485 [Populus alba x Populus x berolinensis]
MEQPFNAFILIMLKEHHQEAIATDAPGSAFGSGFAGRIPSKYALNEDIERFLSGCESVPSSIRTYPDPVKSAGGRIPPLLQKKQIPLLLKENNF